jgi:ABC-type branched-chain amino acid transport system, permease component
MMLAYISPANFSFSDSLLFLSILLLGGIGNSWGVLVATTFVVALPEKFQVIQEYRYLIYSAIVLLMIIFRPAGLLPRRVRSYTGGMA